MKIDCYTNIFRLYNKICALHGRLRTALEHRASKCTSESILYFHIVIINKIHISYFDMFLCYILIEHNSTVPDEFKKMRMMIFYSSSKFCIFELIFFSNGSTDFNENLARSWKKQSLVRIKSYKAVNENTYYIMPISYEVVEIWHPTLFGHPMWNIHCMKDYLMKKILWMQSNSNIIQFKCTDEELLAQLN